LTVRITKEIAIYRIFDYLDKLDSEKDIEIATERLVKDNGWSKLQALSALHSKYQSERRLEEAVIVNRLIEREKS
jgi:hypothetical protein